MLFQNILVPVDMSKQSTRAFKIALDISKKYKSKLTVITCVEIYPSFHLFYQQRPIPKEIEKLNMNFPIVTKKIWGAGSEQVNYFETLDSVVDDETTRSWTEESIYPCLVQEYEDTDYDLRITIVGEKVFIMKRIHNWKTGNKDNFPYGMPENPREKILKHRYPPYQIPKIKPCDDSEHLSLVDLITKLHKLGETKLVAWCFHFAFSCLQDTIDDSFYFVFYCCHLKY